MSAQVASLLVRALSTPSGVTFRVGVVVSWSGLSGNVVTVGGQNLSNLPFIDGIAPDPGDNVMLLRCNNTLMVLGTIVQPA